MQLNSTDVPANCQKDRSKRRFPPKPPPQHIQLSIDATTPVADLLTVDMNKHPEIVADTIAPLLPLLKVGAYIIATLKFFGIGRDKTSAIRAFVRQLDGDATVVGNCVWLLANTVHERTFVARVSERLTVQN